MDEKKSIICISCGKRFYVEKDEYLMRRQEKLCDACLSQNDEDEDAGEELLKLADRGVRGLGNLIGTIGQTLKQKENGKKTNEDIDTEMNDI